MLSRRGFLRGLLGAAAVASAPKAVWTLVEGAPVLAPPAPVIVGMARPVYFDMASAETVRIWSAALARAVSAPAIHRVRLLEEAGVIQVLSYPGRAGSSRSRA